MAKDREDIKEEQELNDWWHSSTLEVKRSIIEIFEKYKLRWAKEQPFNPKHDGALKH